MPKKSIKQKPAWTTRLRWEVAKEWQLTPEEYDRAKKNYAGLDLKKFLQKGLPPSLAELTGPNGEVAYVRNDSNYREHNKYTLVLETPLSLTASQKREALKQSSNFFERLHIADYEQVPKGGKFTRITKKPYTQMTVREGDPAKQPMPEYDVRTIWFNKLRKPYGSRSSQKTVLAKRNAWIKKRYRTLRLKQGHKYASFRLCTMIQKELEAFPSNKFGTWPFKKRNPMILSVGSIQRIVGSTK